jgi:hypothetical protein
VNHRSDPHGVVDLVLTQSPLRDHVLVRANARFAAVDRADRQREQLEVHFVRGWIHQAIHPQPGGPVCVALFSNLVPETVVHVVHRHQRRRRGGVLEHAGVDFTLRLLDDGRFELRIACGDRARDRHTPTLSRRERLRLQDGL